MLVCRPHELRDDACEPVAVVDVERGLHASGGVAAVRTARDGDVAVALRYDSVEAVEDRGIGADDGSSGVDFDVGGLSLSTGVRPSVREPAAMDAAVAGFVIFLPVSKTDAFRQPTR